MEKHGSEAHLPFGRKPPEHGPKGGEPARARGERGVEERRQLSVRVTCQQRRHNCAAGGSRDDARQEAVRMQLLDHPQVVKRARPAAREA